MACACVRPPLLCSALLCSAIPLPPCVQAPGFVGLELEVVWSTRSLTRSGRSVKSTATGRPETRRRPGCYAPAEWAETINEAH
jgi:hypothetical protein